MTVDKIISIWENNRHEIHHVLNDENNIGAVIGEIKRLRTREKLAYVCSKYLNPCDLSVPCDPDCSECHGTGIVFDA